MSGAECGTNYRNDSCYILRKYVYVNVCVFLPWTQRRWMMQTYFEWKSILVNVTLNLLKCINASSLARVVTQSVAHTHTRTWQERTDRPRAKRRSVPMVCTLRSRFIYRHLANDDYNLIVITAI